uniref:Sodium/hydrogen exchanger 10-like n=1 Tax=Geotrypetes seraphini TaxID=260995 RepID=A0A6P8SC98_GEOSA|nr:sodium/hydrogen exchanger 10-like [Geotrypetes seraphini]
MTLATCENIWLLSLDNTCYAMMIATLLKDNIPYTVLLSIIGICMGLLGDAIPSFYYYTRSIGNISPVLLFHICVPILIFNAVFEMGTNALWKSRWQVVLLSLLGYLLNSALSATYAIKICENNWDWYTGLIFGIIISATDPISSVAAQKNTGISKNLIHLVAAEGVFNNSICAILFQIIKQLLQKHGNLAISGILLLLLQFIGSPLFGFVMAKFTEFWLAHIFNSELTEITVTFVMIYLTFCLALWFGMSGTIAVTVLGLRIDNISYSPGIEFFLAKFWEFLTFTTNTLIFTIIGIIIADKTLHDITINDIFSILLLYVGLTVIRLLVIIFLCPLLSRVGYGFNWRWGAAVVWGGIRGAFTLIMVLMAFHNGKLPSKINNKVKFEELFPKTGSNVCPDCKKEIPNRPSPLEIEDMMEEARLRMLKTRMTSYWMQYSSGILNQQATRILISASESYIDNVGRFMDIKDVRQYWEVNRFFVSLRQYLENWMHSIKTQTIKSSELKFLKICYYLVYNERFEFTMYILIAVNAFPIILDFIPTLSDIYNEELQFLNYIFVALYMLEALLKALAMRKAYIFQYWNQFDLSILVIGISEIITEHLLTYFKAYKSEVKIIRLFHFLRVFRALRLCKIILPKLLYHMNSQINRQLIFGYDIVKGFIIGEEYVRNLINQISDQKIITQKLQAVMEIQKQDAMKELGLLQRDHPEVVLSMKTMQAIRTVLNNATETLNSLISDGVIDYNEGAKLETIIQLKIRQLTTFPETIQSPNAEELLSNVPWLENSKNQINFIKPTGSKHQDRFLKRLDVRRVLLLYLESKAKLLLFDYGDSICTEGEMPSGIHLMVSGFVKLHGSKPVYGHFDQEEAQLEGGKIYFTDYRGSGAILADINCLTKQPMEVTITCETLVQTCFIPINDLFEAFDEFLEFPSLEYKIWLIIAIHIAVNILKECIVYQSWTYNEICSWLANAYVEDIDINKTIIYDENVAEAVLVYGSIEDCQLKQVYYAPCIIPRTSHLVQGTANITKILIVPTTLNKNIRLSARRKHQENIFAPCLQHATFRRKGGKFSQRRFSRANDTINVPRLLESVRSENSYIGVKHSRENQLNVFLP